MSLSFHSGRWMKKIQEQSEQKKLDLEDCRTICYTECVKMKKQKNEDDRKRKRKQPSQVKVVIFYRPLLYVPSDCGS